MAKKGKEEMGEEKKITHFPRFFLHPKKKKDSSLDTSRLALPEQYCKEFTAVDVKLATAVVGSSLPPLTSPAATQPLFPSSLPSLHPSPIIVLPSGIASGVSLEGLFFAPLLLLLLKGVFSICPSLPFPLLLSVQFFRQVESGLGDLVVSSKGIRRRRRQRKRELAC